MNTVYHDNKGSLVKSSEEDVRLEQSKRVDDINIKQSESKPEKYKCYHVSFIIVEHAYYYTNKHCESWFKLIALRPFII